MTTSITLKNGLKPDEEQWLAKNIGPRMHYIHNSIGGQGWIAKHTWAPSMVNKQWVLTIEDDRYATFFSLMFPQ
jgi:hypothetical protein